MLTLAIGDFFIPERVIELPSKFCKLLSPNAPAVPSNPKIAQVLCLGNITQSASTLRFLNDLSPSFHIVRGEFDNYNILCQQLANLGHKSSNPLPFYKVVTADNFRIGFTSGYQDVPRHDPLLLLTFAREIDVDILIWGGAHHVEAYTLDGKFFINPGSATGAYTFDWPEIEEKDDDEDEDDEETTLAPSNAKSSGGSEDQGDKEESESDEVERKLSEDDKEKEIEDKQDPCELEPLEEYSTPSFCLLDTHGSLCTLYIYTQVNGEIKVDKVMYQKDE
ncbi:hypothetical protein PUMCH_000044 [Australozyma saopauloensis]|uniref:Vacuolar protein sorting-associated protein 29 n=1 Tax=Australozyma saopauloensis TaxID=291208 RepID=A0AAX4H4B6_9ASCO|nr:hypothetical protein PUMCH_000044 [[Candida] saopauloensis]